LFAQVTPVTRIEILSSLPSRDEMDLLVDYFFDHERFPISIPREDFLRLSTIFDGNY